MSNSEGNEQQILIESSFVAHNQELLYTVGSIGNRSEKQFET
jgi:hypothetical protein